MNAIMQVTSRQGKTNVIIEVCYVDRIHCGNYTRLIRTGRLGLGLMILGRK